MTATLGDKFQAPRLLRRARFYSILLAGVMVGGLLFLGRGQGLAAVVSASEDIGIWRAAAVATLALCNYLLRAIRFRYFLGLKKLRPPFPLLLTVYVAGFAATATPGKLGELLRAWLLKRQFGYKYSDTLPVNVADRAMDVFGATTLAVMSAGVFVNYLQPIFMMALLMMAAWFVLVRASMLITLVNSAYHLVGKRPRLFANLRKVLRGTSELFRPEPLFVGIALGTLGWFLECLTLFICASTFGQLTIAQAVFIFTFANLVGAMTFLPGGVGGTEISIVTLLSSLHFNVQEAAAITLVVRAGTLWFGIACGYAALIVWFRRGSVLPS